MHGLTIMYNDVMYIQAYGGGFLYPKYMFITFGWYPNQWWEMPTNTSQYNCTADQIAEVLRYTLAPAIQEIPLDPHFVAEPGLVSTASNVSQS